MSLLVVESTSHLMILLHDIEKLLEDLGDVWHVG